MNIKATSLALGLAVAALALPAAAQDRNHTAPDRPMMNHTDQPVMNHDSMGRGRMDTQARQHDMHDMGRNDAMRHHGWARRHQDCHWTWRHHHHVRVCHRR